MPGSLNTCCLVGTIGKFGVELRYNQGGTPCASFLLVLTEGTPDGKYFSTLVPVECWGKRSEAASELEAGQLVAVAGKLARHKKGEQWELCVSTFEVTPIIQTVAANN